MSADQLDEQAVGSPFTPPAENAAPSTDDIPPPSPTKVELPLEVEKRLAEWQSLWWWASMYHYGFGVVSVTASATAAAMGGVAAQFLAVIAALSTALIGFTQPERRYLKFVNAWRVLDVAALRYKYGRLSLDDLFAALEQGERIISEYESKAERNPATETHVEDK